MEKLSFKTCRDGDRNLILVGGREFDWSVDLDSYTKACGMGPEYARAAQQDIERHFVESLSDFVGRELTMADIQQAIMTGWLAGRP